MYDKKNYSSKYLLEIKKCLELNYKFKVIDIGPAQRGVYGETWYVYTRNRKYFVKINYLSCILEQFKESLVALKFMENKGIDFINNVVQTKNKDLYIEFFDGILAVFEFIEGQRCRRENIDLVRLNLYEIFTQLYQVPILNGMGLSENFPIACANFVLDKINAYELFKRYYTQITEYFHLLREMSKLCKKITFNYYITHGDAGNNLIQNGNNFYLVDWDTFRVSCPERDIWFMIRSEDDIKVIQEIFYKKGFSYEIEKERLLYYPTYSFFYYLKCHIVAIEETNDPRKKRLILNYVHRLFFNGFISKQIEKLKDSILYD